jgi:hypothetical protein
MQNTRFGYQEIYTFIRNAYINSFPYPIVPTGEYILQKAIVDAGIDGSIEIEGLGYECILHSATAPEKVKDTVFQNDPIKVKADFEEFLKNADNVTALVNDIDKLQSWLEKHHYITEEFIASEKMLKSYDL